MSNDRDSEWYEEFWSHIDRDLEDEGTSAIRLLAELHDAGIIDREGDHLVGNDINNETDRVYLTTSDQYLVRRIFDAVTATNRPRL